MPHVSHWLKMILFYFIGALFLVWIQSAASYINVLKVFVYWQAVGVEHLQLLQHAAIVLFLFRSKLNI